MMLLPPPNPPIASWQQRRVWIIGASSGIGAAVASQLLQQGAQVILSARNLAALQEVAAAHASAIVQPLDVSQPAAWQQAWAELEARQALPDLVMFCAADYRPERSWDIHAATVSHTLATNLAGVYFGLETILPALMARHGGGIALVASVAGYVGLPGATVYGPGKAALINLAEILYSDLRPKGLNVYLVNPGFVKTDLTDKNDFPMPAIQTPQQAATAIWRGISEGRFEIHFPRRFTAWLKILRLLPFRLRFMLFQRFMLS